jgi:hypothetical protein
MLNNLLEHSRQAKGSGSWGDKAESQMVHNFRGKITLKLTRTLNNHIITTSNHQTSSLI